MYIEHQTYLTGRFIGSSLRPGIVNDRAALDARFLYQIPGIAQNLDPSRWATAHHPKFVTPSDILLWLPGVPGWLGYFCGGRIGFFRCRGCRMGGRGMQEDSGWAGMCKQM